MVINEASLIAYLDSDEIIKCVELYQYNNSMFVLLEYMENGQMTDIIKS